jgi:hypothetical protein
MALSVIGAGFGRTGTLSLKAALEQLGFGPCHHMAEILAKPRQLPLWTAAARGETVDWEEVLEGYLATVDWPSACFWRELAATWPTAKVVLSTRDADAWYASFENTILRVIGAMDKIADPHIRATVEMGGRLIGDNVFHGRADDPDHAKAVFRAHHERVRAAIPAERLLVFEVGEGWQPLCAFLEVPVPEAPFPNLNDAEQFRALVGGST